MEEIIGYLPEGWEEKAKETGALQRGREIRTAEELLELNMLYITNEGSFAMAAAGLYMSKGIEISKIGAYKRIRGSGEWLRVMAQEMCKSEGMVIKKPEFLGERQVKLIDASDETTRGKKKSTWRMHFAFNLFEFCYTESELTGNKEGERLTRHRISEEDIIIADRIYGTITGMEHVLSNKGDFILRLKSKAFNLYDEAGNRVELLSQIKELKAHESIEVRCYYKTQKGKLRPLRIVAMKKDEKAIKESSRKMARKAVRKQEKAVPAETAEINEYVILATSLEYTNEQILELYRARWQIEQAFYRLKSLFGYGDVPSKNPETVKAWFYGKLFLAVLCEKILKTEIFSPSVTPVVGTKCVE
jgi:IS4 transposase